MRPSDRMTPGQRREAIRLFREEGWSCRRIALHVGGTPSTISRLLRASTRAHRVAPALDAFASRHDVRRLERRIAKLEAKLAGIARVLLPMNHDDDNAAMGKAAAKSTPSDGRSQPATFHTFESTQSYSARELLMELSRRTGKWDSTIRDNIDNSRRFLEFRDAHAQDVAAGRCTHHRNLSGCPEFLAAMLRNANYEKIMSSWLPAVRERAPRHSGDYSAKRNL